MNDTNINGVILNDTISKKLCFLQEGYASAIASGLDNAIGYLLEKAGSECDNPKVLINILATLHNARTELLGLIPDKEGGVR